MVTRIKSKVCSEKVRKFSIKAVRFAGCRKNGLNCYQKVLDDMEKDVMKLRKNARELPEFFKTLITYPIERL